MAKLTKKQKRLREFYHYLVGTILIIFGGHWLSSITGLEQWAMNNSFIGWVGLFLYYLAIYILIDQSLHKLFNID